MRIIVAHSSKRFRDTTEQAIKSVYPATEMEFFTSALPLYHRMKESKRVIDLILCGEHLPIVEGQCSEPFGEAIEDIARGMCIPIMIVRGGRFVWRLKMWEMLERDREIARGEVEEALIATEMTHGNAERRSFSPFVDIQMIVDGEEN